MKTNLFKYIKESWGKSFLIFLGLYIIILAACTYDALNGMGIGLWVWCGFTVVYVIVISIDYAEWKERKKQEIKEEESFKGTTYDPRKQGFNQ